MIPRMTDHPCNQWCTDPDLYFFPSCIVPNYLDSEATHFHHKNQAWHKSGLDNPYIHQDNRYYRDKLEKMIGIYHFVRDEIFVSIQTIYAIIKSSSTFKQTVCIGAWFSALKVLKVTLVFTFCCDIFIPEKTYDTKLQ